MIILNIMNMKEFLKTVNECTGAVNMVSQEGVKTDINKKYGIQKLLLAEHEKNKKCTTLCLDIPVPRDYINVVNYYAGDC
mgnify:CR=1 FL=1